MESPYKVSDNKPMETMLRAAGLERLCEHPFLVSLTGSGSCAPLGQRVQDRVGQQHVKVSPDW